MKLVKFRIKNYKSIIDSGDCYFSDKLTIIAGKNESGKTSVLEALEDFHQDKTIRDEAKPIEGNGIPEVSISFFITQGEINAILQEMELDISITKDIQITLTKKFGSNTYTLDSESRASLDIPNIYNASKKQILESVKKIGQLIKTAGSEVKFPTPNFDKQKISDFKNEVTNFKNQNTSLTDVVAEIVNIEKASEDYYNREKLAADFIEKLVEEQLPYFILFSSFDDEFPKSITIATLAQNEWAKDLERVSSFSIQKMTSGNQQEQFQHENSVNIDFSKKFEKYWTQDKIKLQVKKDGAEINFWIIENNKPYYPSQRSKGQQWYLSFYVKIVARLQEDKPNVILIDEPGLYLHAKAQKDLLQVLSENINDNPVIFSTHSPYLITEENLESVRLIEKTPKGSKVLGKIHAHPTADKETLTPVLTAIGLGINDSITNLDQKNNVVVEGPEDTFFLRAFKELEKNDIKLNFVSGGGSSNMGIVGAVLEGWGADVYYLYDNDQGKKDGVKQLKAWKVLPEAIKIVLNQEGSTIVDIFAPEDFKTYVMDDPALTYTGTNSDYIRSLKPRPDKVLLARMFLQKARAGSVSLSDTTKQNISLLFKEIEFKDVK